MDAEARYLTQLLSLKPNPEAAAALRNRKEAIVNRWDAAVQETLPKADEMTIKQVRDSIPLVIDQIIVLFETARAEELQKFFDLTRLHGIVRFGEKYSIRELIIEYRVLRMIVLDEFQQLRAAGQVDLGASDLIAVNVALDVALQQAVVAFVEHQQEQLRNATEAEARYLSFLSHDLRNNLNAITLSLELLVNTLREDQKYADEHETLMGLRRSIWETMEGMDRLMQAERLKRKSVEVKIGPVKLRPLVERVVRSSLHRAQAKGIEMINSVPAQAVVVSDEQLLTLILQNLVGNGIRYTEKGYVKVSFLAGAGPDGRDVLAVEDTGPGIPKEELPRMFKAFERGTRQGEPGAGLGLAIVTAAANLLEANINVDSELARGSTFRVTLKKYGGASKEWLQSKPG